MADAADYANNFMQAHLDAALAKRARAVTTNLSPECEDCGEDIPLARRQAAPHVTTCIECQSSRELKARGMRR